MNCETLQEYLDRYGPLVADRARQAFEPLHVPATDAVVTLDLKRPMLPAQTHVVTAAVKTLKRQKSVFLCCECGTGKTQMGACTVHAHADGKPYRAIVMCPPHLVETWRAELERVFPDGAVDVHVLEKWTELLRWPRGKPARPTWLIMGETLAKNGPYWRPAAVKDSQGVLRCPDCGSQLRAKASAGGNFLTLKDLERSRKRCTAEVPTRRLNADGEPRHAALRRGLVAVHRPSPRLGTGRLHPQAHAGRLRLPGVRRSPRGEIGDLGPRQRPGRPGGLLPQGDRHDRHADRRQGGSCPVALVPVVAQEPKGRGAFLAR